MARDDQIRELGADRRRKFLKIEHATVGGRQLFGRGHRRQGLRRGDRGRSGNVDWRNFTGAGAGAVVVADGMPPPVCGGGGIAAGSGMTGAGATEMRAAGGSTGTGAGTGDGAAGSFVGDRLDETALRDVCAGGAGTCDRSSTGLAATEAAATGPRDGRGGVDEATVRGATAAAGDSARRCTTAAAGARPAPSSRRSVPIQVTSTIADTISSSAAATIATRGPAWRRGRGLRSVHGEKIRTRPGRPLSLRFFQRIENVGHGQSAPASVGVPGAGSPSSRISVSGPATPSSTIPAARWKRRTAAVNA